MVLSVLSGEQPVSDAIAQAQISRPTYYKLEMRALQGMLAALSPLDPGSAQQTVAKERIAHLEALVKRLEQQKRRVQRLWLLSCKSARMPLKIARRGRPAKTLPSPATRRAAPHSPARAVKPDTNPTRAPGDCSP
jgi:hypothetical protein